MNCSHSIKKTLDEHTQGMVNEKTSQKSLAGIDNDELTKMAQDAQERGSTYYGKK